VRVANPAAARLEAVSLRHFMSLGSGFTVPGPIRSTLNSSHVLFGTALVVLTAMEVYSRADNLGARVIWFLPGAGASNLL
jgi:hypothetical protein